MDQQRTAYGPAAGRDPRTGVRWAAMTRRHETRVALLRLVGRSDGTVAFRGFWVAEPPPWGEAPDGAVGTAPIAAVNLPSRFRLPGGTAWSPCEVPGEGPQLEGLVLDDRVLHTAQEDVGIWRIPLSPSGFGRPELIDRVRPFVVPARWDAAREECVPDGPGYGGRRLTADVEGLSVANGTLSASSRGDSRFVVYGKHVRDLRIVTGRSTVEHSDGSSISTASLGHRFPHGVLVVHDGERHPAAGDPLTTGFAVVRLEDVLGR